MKTIKTSAKTIAKRAKLMPFSGIHTLIGMTSGKGSIFYFPEPDIIYKKDQTEAENMERAKALFYQLFNYNTQTDNLYFIRLEISALIQEIKLAVNSLKNPVKVSFEKIYKEIIEIENKGGFYKKTDYWNKRIERLKNRTNAFIEKLNVENSSFFDIYLTQTVGKYKSEKNKFKNLLNSVYMRGKLSVLENSLIKPVNYVTAILNREQWQKDAYKFYNIYNSMGEAERREFLNALSITENEIAYVRNMTKEQWSVFLNNILPAVYLFVDNYINKDNYIKILENNNILKNISNLNQEQWLDFKIKLFNNKNDDFKHLTSFFKTEQSSNLYEDWKAEQKNFIEFVHDNKYIHELYNAASVVLSDYTELKLQNDEFFTAHNIEIDDVSLKFSEWLSYLTEKQWEEVRAALNESGNNRYIQPLLDILKQPSQEEHEPDFSAEKRKLVNYINENKKTSLEIIRVLESKNEIKEELEKWVDLKDVHTLLRKEEENKEIIKSSLLSSYLENEYSRQENTENTVSSEISEWLSYLTEKQWEEVKTALKNNNHEEYMSPVLEIFSGKDFKDSNKLRLLQKEGFIRHINDNKNLAEEFIRLVSENKVLNKSISNWLNKDINKFDIKKGQFNKRNNQTNINYNFSKLQNLRFSSKTKMFINDWISDINIRKYKYIKEAQTPKTYNVNSKLKNINNLFVPKNYADEIWQSSSALENSGITLKNNNLMYKKDNKDWNNIVNYSLLNSFKSINSGGSGTVFDTYKTGIFTNIEIKDINKRSDFNKNLNKIWSFYNPLGNVYSSENNNESVYSNFGYIYFNYNEPISNFSEHKDFRSVYNEKFSGRTYKNYSSDAFNTNRTGILRNINKTALNAENYNITSNNLSYLLAESNNNAAENEFSPYKTADLVVVKKDYGHAAVNNTPKMPEIQSEVKKAVNSRINDIITVKHNDTEEGNGNKAVYELTKRMNLQQKEIEKILTSQKQMLKVTDISIVTEKIMNQMQSQLRLEKLRRGL